MTGRIALTGVTGHLGGRVAALLAERGHPLRLVVRDPSRAPDLPDAEVAVASYDDAAAVRAALTGIEVALMVSAGESATRVADHLTFVAAAAEAGVRHLVYTSFAAAAPDAVFTLGRDHWATEQAIRNSGMNFTLLRDNFYTDVLPEFADADGVVRGPAADGRCAFVVRDDIAAVAAAVLASPTAHAGRTYTLTGPDSLTFAEALAEVNAASGRRYRFEDETLEEAYASRRRDWPGHEDWEYDAWVSTYVAVASGRSRA
ncbi:NAD(P)H-binding protein [Propioniciclava coleopterorum]|uniref:NmrA family NAD(P)-binding protein n=1 Tax=Propioniciclava coleopterorum TaxID=2714937 RepID=UPI001FE43AC9|nr:NAD(P)H-binding protein [Propioniciclava coleopterorum]